MPVLNVLDTDMITRDEKVAHIADLFIEKFAIRISPISALEGALFGTSKPVGDSKRIVLEGAVQAAVELWSLTPETHSYSVRLANQAIDQALRLMRGDIEVDKHALAAVITRALPLI